MFGFGVAVATGTGGVDSAATAEGRFGTVAGSPDFFRLVLAGELAGLSMGLAAVFSVAVVASFSLRLRLRLAGDAAGLSAGLAAVASVFGIFSFFRVRVGVGDSFAASVFVLVSFCFRVRVGLGDSFAASVAGAGETSFRWLRCFAGEADALGVSPGAGAWARTSEALATIARAIAGKSLRYMVAKGNSPASKVKPLADRRRPDSGKPRYFL